jgi:hypothetical protein
VADGDPVSVKHLALGPERRTIDRAAAVGAVEEFRPEVYHRREKTTLTRCTRSRRGGLAEYAEPMERVEIVQREGIRHVR